MAGESKQRVCKLEFGENVQNTRVGKQVSLKLAILTTIRYVHRI